MHNTAFCWMSPATLDTGDSRDTGDFCFGQKLLHSEGYGLYSNLIGTLRENTQSAEEADIEELLITRNRHCLLNK